MDGPIDAHDIPPAFAHHLARQWLGLIDAGLVMKGRA